jgi:hypothetical protein
MADGSALRAERPVGGGFQSPGRAQERTETRAYQGPTAGPDRPLVREEAQYVAAHRGHVVDQFLEPDTWKEQQMLGRIGDAAQHLSCVVAARQRGGPEQTKPVFW